MFCQILILTGCLALVFFCGHASAAYNEVCSTDNPCATDDNTECKTSSGCVQGRCVCKNEYSPIESGGSTSCLKEYGVACGGNSECGSNVCTTTCQCETGKSWQNDYSACVTTDQAFGDTCGDATECAVNADADGACNADTQCDCKDNYIKSTGHVCRKPYLDEACDSGVGCIATAGVLNAKDPECPAAGTCTCADADERVTYEGTTYCDTIVAAASKKAATLVCTSHNQCLNGRCIECPDSAGFICLDESNAGNNLAIQPILALVLLLFAGNRQLCL